ncbi:MAG: TusE/DsrC/DsvC family sulfur relay protein [Candidatus Bipolaricaulota bacterium]
MPFLECSGRRLRLSDEGFLVHARQWDDDVARLLARTAEGLAELTDDHWSVIRCIRRHYLARRRAPQVRAVCQETQLSLKRIYELFPSGPAKGACKVAGLPRPDGCV